MRHVSLEVVNHAVQSQKLDEESLGYVREHLLRYAQQRYGTGSSDIDSAALQNKLTQTLTYLFTSLYPNSWTSFLDDFRNLAGESLGITNPPATILYLRILRSVHDEIADVMIPRTQDEQKRCNDLKDLIRARDAQKIATSWQEILSRWRNIDLDTVEFCLRCVSRYVSWIDISLVVNPDMLQYLWDLAGQQGVTSSESREGKVRDSAIDTFTEIVAKKMPPGDKVQLIKFLNLPEVLAQLTASPGLSQFRSTSNYDTDLGETVARLTNMVVLDIVKVLDTETIDGSIRSEADNLLQLCMPHFLRFFSDEYDEICSTVVPSVTDLLGMFRKQMKSGALPQHYTALLQPILDTIINKMKYDDTAEWGAEDDQTDEAEFQELRKRLHVLQQMIAAINQPIYLETLSRLVADTFSGLESSNNKMTWRDLDLALYEMYLFGELAVKNNGLYQKQTPSNEAAEHLIQMMHKLISSNLASHPHPSIQLQYMEICVRYWQFFEQNTGSIPRALENFVSFIHSNHVKVRTRSWYLFYRFVQLLRRHLGNVAQTVIQAIGNLLTIKAEVPEENGDDDESSDANEQSADAVFTAQLYLFEAVGSVASTSQIPVQNQTFYARSMLEPLLSGLNEHIASATGGDERAILQVHHLIMAIGTLAKGFCDWMPGVTHGGSAPPSEVSAEFVPASEAILTALEALKQSMQIRTAARFAFSRMLGVLGSHILQQLPRWINGLLAETSTKDEMATFLRLLDQIVFGFKTEIYSILDELLSPLLQRVFAGLSEPTTGTDDEIQLTELKFQYLTFVLVILNNDLGAVLVSPSNQGSFEPLLSTLEHFTRDANEYSTAKLAYGVLAKMTSVWGGPDMSMPPSPTQAPAPTIPGFDAFIMQRFSPLTWSLLSSPAFNAKDAQARSALAEAATLQWTILRKCGAEYERYLRETEMRGMGFTDEMLTGYLKEMQQKDVRDFKKFFTGFVAQAKGG